MFMTLCHFPEGTEIIKNYAADFPANLESI